jgi:2,3-bisphosphoglycerate-independent phosphoglycerate mutase
MVGHTGSFDSTIIGVESVDLALSRILKSVDKAGGVALITADHGNADAMYELDKSGHAKKNKDGSPVARTAHSLNPVPCILYSGGKYSLKVKDGEFGLSNVAATIVNLLGYRAPAMWDESLIEVE